ncbi:MAG: hypothetical protein A2504_04935 [Bdellovibrionales bacterium RIFOXYD12_FULL_39_22]|nr:MAG: hypothetical protein A2385_06890 [Bdellovibrionales bacterium RIFOXYB1_FULL_39_21]OFZ41993.1 MAG: hypothetical protein A2485_08860 [Bdellovibrionales bacterium RIFOXYC12_FULL_39_17]OFZ50709.1 MAG: hypothetical protein A2404_05810 [Bdellovibrionales bacterium RIFOXYC1_FULL_39_130]OFZ76456.1 MAG: hypothetical protein A2451_09435 [Bdellovibrionales bacterium RIFOXYC2_FULL_39_8]OFZ77932.1 MAG: hypothetical protein A2560_00980 [Bdellovibrionales bacterium RIFOXYD1_FULL_39_84]OFZ93632.1 MAG:
MSKWGYEGLDAAGKKVTGSINATSDKDVRKKLRAKGIRVKRLKAPSFLEFDFGEYMMEKGLVQPISQKDLLYFTKQLSTMFNAGIPILQALEILHSQEPKLALKKAIKQVAIRVGEGQTIAEALSQERGFSKLYCNMVRAGEIGGILDVVLDKLASHLEKIERTKQQIKSAMTYPAIVVVVGILVIAGMLYFVVPVFVDMLKDTGQQLPWVTQTLIDSSNFLKANTHYIIGGIILFFFLIKAHIKTPAGKLQYDNISLFVPIMGGIVLKGNLSAFTRTLSTLLTAGISLVDALDICIETIDNRVIAADIKKVKKAVVEGQTITEPLLKISYFPSMVAQMIRVGEQSGKVDEMLLKVSDVFEEEVNHLITNMTKLIEPIILVFLAGVVGFILVAMYLPMFMSAGGVD